MAALSGSPSCGPLEPFWRAVGCADQYACGNRFPSGLPAAIGDIGAFSVGSKMFPRRSAREFNEDGTLLNPAIIRRVELQEGRTAWETSVRWLKRKQDFRPGVADDLQDGAYAITDDFDDLPIDWCEGTVQGTIPRKSRIRFGKPHQPFFVPDARCR
jgi:hypothetical protein